MAGAAIASLLAGLSAMSVCVRKTRLTNKKKKSVYLSFVSLHISSIFGGRKNFKKKPYQAVRSAAKQTDRGINRSETGLGEAEHREPRWETPPLSSAGLSGQTLVGRREAD